MVEPLKNARVGTYNEGAPRSLPETDLLGQDYAQVGIELPVGSGHFVVYSAQYAPHLIEAALTDVRALVAAHYAPVEAALVADETPAQGEQTTADQSAATTNDEVPTTTRKRGSSNA